MTSADHKFIRDWEFQKEGPKWKYYLQYSIAWTVVIFLSLFFIVKVIMSNRNIGGWLSFVTFFIIAVLLAIFTTHMVYETNEKKLKKILEREKRIL